MDRDTVLLAGPLSRTVFCQSFVSCHQGLQIHVYLVSQMSIQLSKLPYHHTKRFRILKAQLKLQEVPMTKPPLYIMISELDHDLDCG
jgi:hypothetical protein